MIMDDKRIPERSSRAEAFGVELMRGSCSVGRLLLKDDLVR
jgi:hypothetical protein